ncbi:MAG: hypothetical protein IJS10_03885 [Alphaproteobacteria bacterium]|nr:hypothetical protein [Alphaproteobacteria bacterium]
MAKRWAKNVFMLVICLTTTHTFSAEITEGTLNKAAEDIMREHEKDYKSEPFLNDTEHMDSLKEAIKLALREKVYTTPGAESLGDIFDNTLGNPATENYLFIRMLFKYMVDEELNIDDAIKRLHDVIENRLDDIEKYAKTANIEKMLKKSSEEIAEKIRKISETHNVLPARNIFELVKSIEPSVKAPGEAINKILSKIPSTNQTLVQSKAGDTLTFLLNENKSGGKPAVINWRTTKQKAGLLQEYTPEIRESLQKNSQNEQHEQCLYSEKLNLQSLNGTSDAPRQPHASFKVDLISANAVTNATTDQEIRELVRMQGVIALITGHDVLIISMRGFDVSQKRLVEIGKIYNEELNNPLIQGKFKKVMFIKENATTQSK